MSNSDSHDLSTLLDAWGNGNEAALPDLMSLVYPEVRRIARKHLARRGSGLTLESAAVANEVYLKLFAARGIRCENRAHFLAVCAQMIRRILLDHARRRRYLKRGGDGVRISLSDLPPDALVQSDSLLHLDDALESLVKFDPRKARVVELRYFGGLTVEEIAYVLGLSPETIARDWKIAKAWLHRELTPK